MCVWFISFTGVLLRLQTHDGNTYYMLRASGPRNGSRYNIIIRDIISAGIPVKNAVISTLTMFRIIIISLAKNYNQRRYNDINL